MRMMRLGALLALVVGARLGGQEAPPGWTFSGMLGAQFRTERGTLIDGATIDVGVGFPAEGSTRWGVDAGVAAVLARAGVGGVRVSAVETSVEVGAMAMTDLLRTGDWRLEGGAGAVASVSLGCGRYQQDPVDTTAGSGGCVNAFARRGASRVGARVRLLGEWMSPRASFFLAAIASVNTVASGDHVAPGLLAGVRVPLHSVR